ncbi:hypothetical protein R6Q59_019253 [Mikania micrantha]
MSVNFGGDSSGNISFFDTEYEPIVQTNTRGRPTLNKKQQKDHEPARHSSFTNSQGISQHQETEAARHSSFVVSQDALLLMVASYRPTRRLR